MPQSMEHGESSDDDLPSVEELMRQRKPTAESTSNGTTALERKSGGAKEKPKESTLRRRKLGQIADDYLRRPLGHQETFKSQASTGQAKPAPKEAASSSSQGLRVTLRERKPILGVNENGAGMDSDEDETETETVVEEITIVDDSVYFSFSSSDGGDGSGLDTDEDFDWVFESKPRGAVRGAGRAKGEAEDATVVRSTTAANKAPIFKVLKSQRPTDTSLSISIIGGASPPPEPSNKARPRRKCQEKGPNIGGCKGRSSETCSMAVPFGDDLTGPFSKLRLEPGAPSNSQGDEPLNGSRPSTPPNTLPKTRPSGLVSPTKKFPRLPATPHHPATDAFWSQEVTDSWVDDHSPRKLFGPTDSKGVSKRPSAQGAASPTKQEKAAKAAQRQAKKDFESVKHQLADAFLRELDDVITEGKLASLSASTGGIRIIWTNKLNTTAGRAKWRRETIRTTHRSVSGAGRAAVPAAAATEATVTTTHRHHASIELAEKVIDSEDRLLNVIAHEFCHLANFMVSGVTGNPHGREFKAWAAHVSRAFGASRGIEVTTKHSYDIDFKYVWSCASCGLAYKRHSRSIDPQRHRCGSCRGELRQTKPVPRGVGAAGGGAGGGEARKKKAPSEYQLFMKEQMKVIRQENPGSPQKDIMRQVGERWAKKTVKATATATRKATTAMDSVGDMADRLVDLTISDKLA